MSRMQRDAASLFETPIINARRSAKPPLGDIFVPGLGLPGGGWSLLKAIDQVAVVDARSEMENIFERAGKSGLALNRLDIDRRCTASNLEMRSEARISLLDNPKAVK